MKARLEAQKVSPAAYQAMLDEINGLPTSTREWRLITAKASTQLAKRVNASSLWTE